MSASVVTLIRLILTLQNQQAYGMYPQQQQYTAPGYAQPQQAYGAYPQQQPQGYVQYPVQPQVGYAGGYQDPVRMLAG